MTKRYFWMKSSTAAEAGNSAAGRGKAQSTSKTASLTSTETLGGTIRHNGQPDHTVTGGTIRTGSDGTITGGTIRTGPDDTRILGGTIRHSAEAGSVSFNILEMSGVKSGDVSFYIEREGQTARAFASEEDARKFSKGEEFKAWLGNGSAILTSIVV